MHVAAGQTDASSAHDLALAERTVWLSRHRLAEPDWTDSRSVLKCSPPRQYYPDIQARAAVLACQKPAEVDPTRAG
jgi:hypothetical protein